MSDSSAETHPVLLILGTRDICAPLVHLALPLDYRLIICGSQAGFADPQVYRGAECHTVDFTQLTSTCPVSIDDSTFVVIATREHAYDETCLRQVLSAPAAYVGLMGNSRRVGATLDRLAGDGFDDELLNRVHAPIGLRLRAKTHPEIALSIIGEVVSVRRNREATA